MTRNSTRLPVLGSDATIAVGLVDEWFDPIEAGLRDRVGDFIQRMIESELEAVLSRRGSQRESFAVNVAASVENTKNSAERAGPLKGPVERRMSCPARQQCYSGVSVANILD